VDEKGNPIEGAKATLHPGDNMDGGNHDYNRITDKDGLFSIVTHGMGLAVDVAKEGYYALPESGGNFGYVAGSHSLAPHPHSDNPAIFILRKMGETESLIVVHRSGLIPKDGKPLQMSLTTEKGGIYDYQGDIQIQSWVQDQDPTKTFDWRCTITVLGGGGLQPRTGGNLPFRHRPMVTSQMR